MSQQPIMIMAGGTGGHVYPALAVADELRARGVPVIWMGTHKGIEARLVPAANIQIEWLAVSGLRGKGVMTLLLAPMKLIHACYQAWKILRKTKPCAVLGMGGFVAGPGGLMARVMGKPLLIHEQNAKPGLTNRLLAKIATQVMQAFPNSFKQKSAHVGNPVRREISTLPSPEQRFKNRDGALRLFVFGGSLGATHLNSVVPEALAKLSADKKILVRHQSGEKNLEQTQLNYANAKVTAKVMPYIENMAEAYAWADVVLCRAGAMTIAELAAVGVASILIPYPYAVDDHQTANAHYLSDADAAILIPQAELDADNLVKILAELNREKLLSMANKTRQLGMPESTRIVAEHCCIAGGIAC